ncbi:MAG: hypothetical protein AAGJ10_01735 [Bacteroidota bacterium]
MRRIVSDTGPLITLEKLTDGYTFIRALYDQVVIPASVLRELTDGGPESYLAHFAIEDLVLIADEPVRRREVESLDRLDAGEQDAIQVALDLGLPLLIEEEMGRRVARSAGLKISGIAGQIGRAAHEGHIPTESAQRYLKQLYGERRINRRVFEAVLNHVEQNAG